MELCIEDYNICKPVHHTKI